MSFNNPAIFHYPAVQYIPMKINTVQKGTLNQTTPLSISPQIIVGEECLKWQYLLTDPGLNLLERLPIEGFPILALHLSVNDVKYRSFFVTMTGKKNYGKYHLFTIPKRYFYKNKLCFELYDEVSSEKLANYSLFMPKLK